MKSNAVKNSAVFRCLFIPKFDCYSDSNIEVYIPKFDFYSDSNSNFVRPTIVGSSPFFTFRYTSLFTLVDFEELCVKYGNRAFAKQLFNQLSNIQYHLFVCSADWFDGIRRSNGLFSIEKVRKDFLSNGGIAADCPLCLEMADIDTKSANLYEKFDSALQFAAANKIIDVGNLLYVKSKNGRIRKENIKYTTVGKSLIHSTIFLTYKKFEKFLDEYSSNEKKPKTFLELFNGDIKKAEEFRSDLITLGMGKDSSIRQITALVGAALETSKITPNKYSLSILFKLFISEFGISIDKNAKPRKGGKQFEKLKSKACRFWGS